MGCEAPCAPGGHIIPVAAVGLYTIPVMAMPLVGMTLFLGYQALLGHPVDWGRRLVDLGLLHSITLVLLGVVADFSLRKGRTPFWLTPHLFLGGLAFALAKRNMGFPRIRLSLLPSVLISASGGLVALSNLLPTRFRVPALATTGLLPCSLLSSLMAMDKPVLLSDDTGGFPEGSLVAEHRIEGMGPNDQLLTDPVSSAPLLYYLRLRPGG